MGEKRREWDAFAKHQASNGKNLDKSEKENTIDSGKNLAFQSKRGAVATGQGR